MNAYRRRKFRMYYLTTSGGLEIDLILERANEDPILIEIKSSRNVQPRHLAHLKALHKDYPSFKKYCLCQEPDARYVDGVEIVPWREGLRTLELT